LGVRRAERKVAVNRRGVAASLRVLGAALGFLVLAPVSRATESQYKYYSLSHLRLTLCYYYPHHETDFLYYKGLAEILNLYIVQKVTEGTLRPKRVEIHIACHTPEVNAVPIVEVSQSRKSYDIVLAKDRDPNLYQLVRILDYFSSKNWKSFCCYDMAKNDAASHSFDRILDREVGELDMSFFVGRQQVVFHRDELRVIYEADRLFYELASQRLDLRPADPLPVKVRERYLMGTEGAIVVYGKGRELRRESIPCRLDLPIAAQAFAKWVNINTRCGKGEVLAYSYDRNRFYKVDARSWSLR
jgi:hypothetical protein